MEFKKQPYITYFKYHVKNNLRCLSNWNIGPPWNIKKLKVSWIKKDLALAISGYHYPYCRSYRVSQQCNTNRNVSRFRVPWINTHNLDSGKTNNAQHQGSRRWVPSKLMLIKPHNYDSTTHIHQWYQQDSLFPHHNNCCPYKIELTLIPKRNINYKLATLHICDWQLSTMTHCLIKWSSTSGRLPIANTIQILVTIVFPNGVATSFIAQTQINHQNNS